MTIADDNCTAGDAYESYMGRWSRLLARTFVGWLGSPRGAGLMRERLRPGGIRGTGPAPSYASSLSQERRRLFRDRLASRLTVEADGSIRLKARAWAVRGVSG